MSRVVGKVQQRGRFFLPEFFPVNFPEKERTAVVLFPCFAIMKSN